MCKICIFEVDIGPWKTLLIIESKLNGSTTAFTYLTDGST